MERYMGGIEPVARTESGWFVYQLPRKKRAGIRLRAWAEMMVERTRSFGAKAEAKLVENRVDLPTT